ncbi:hypothetical protein [Amycolatopsis sp. lyj-109]|uniref:hypothetical protein n=1 Tax=Amycolatopsis sp. lyj-109 TaxID=2789287 RepID=UPI0039782529
MILTDERRQELLQVRATNPGTARQACDPVSPARAVTVASADPASWDRTVWRGVVRGLVAGRSPLYPPAGNTRAAVEAAAKVLEAAK